MQRSDLPDLAAFVAIAEALSFRDAATRLGLTPSALSHTMRQLEQRLGVRLLHRTTRSVALTDAGRRLLVELRPAMDQIVGALESLKEERQRPSGHLRIYAHHTVAMAVIAPVWERYLSIYPDVHLEIWVEDGSVDIIARGFDAGIGPRNRASADMIAVRVNAPMHFMIVGAPSYFASRGRPNTPDDLAAHSCIQIRLPHQSTLLEWPFERNGTTHQVKVKGRLTVNNAELAVRAAVDGLGLAFTLDTIALPFLRSGQLLHVLDDWSAVFEGFILYYPGRRQVPAALRALIDMIRAGNDSKPNSTVRASLFGKD